jgi:DNA modification methylase
MKKQMRLDVKADPEKVGSSIRYQFHLHLQSHMEEIGHTMDQFILWAENEHNNPKMRKEAMEMADCLHSSWFYMKKFWEDYEPIDQFGASYRHLITDPDEFRTLQIKEAAEDRRRVSAVINRKFDHTPSAEDLAGYDRYAEKV